ncbi:MAG: hypothetical protein WCK42_00350, partial [Myxococcaceae bacterium]
MIERHLQQILRDTVLSLWPELAVPPIAVELPKNPDHGDYACNIAMILAKLLGLSPREIAQKITQNLKDPDGVIQAAEIAGP